MSDVSTLACRVLPPVADHGVVEVARKFSVPHSVVSRRIVWDFAKADWTKVADALASQYFSFLDADSPSQGAKRLTQIIL
eukprot:14426710-Heterocapsa_arctica.AAC.1